MEKLIDKESGRLSLSSFLVKVDEKRRKVEVIYFLFDLSVAVKPCM